MASNYNSHGQNYTERKDSYVFFHHGCLIFFIIWQSRINGTSNRSTKLKFTYSWFTLVRTEAFLSIGEITYAMAISMACALVTLAVIWAWVSKVSLNLLTYIIGGTELILIFAIRWLQALSTDIQVIQALVWLAHVVIVEALLSILNLRVAGVVINTTVLRVLVTMVVWHFLSIVKSWHGIVGETVIASVGLMNKFWALFAHALHAIVALFLIGELWNTVIVIVSICISNKLAELPLIITANGVIVNQLSISGLILFDIAFSLVLFTFRTGVHAIVFGTLLVMRNWDEAAVLTAVWGSYLLPPQEVYFTFLVFVAIVQIGRGDYTQRHCFEKHLLIPM